MLLTKKIAIYGNKHEKQKGKILKILHLKITCNDNGVFLFFFFYKLHDIDFILCCIYISLT